MCHAVTDTGVDIGVDIDTDTDADTRTQSCKHDMGGAPEAGVPILCHRERERQNERVRERASWRAREKAFHIRQRHALVTCTHSSRWSAFYALKEERGGTFFRKGRETTEHVLQERERREHVLHHKERERQSMFCTSSSDASALQASSAPTSHATFPVPSQCTAAAACTPDG